MRSQIARWLVTVFGCLAATWATAEPTGLDAGEVKLTLEHYQKLMAAAQSGDRASVAWGAAQVQLQLPSDADSLVEVTVNTEIRTHEADAIIAILPGDVALRGAEVDGRAALLTRRDGWHALWVAGGPARYTVQLRYMVPTERGGLRSAVVPLPPVPSSSLSIARNGAGGAVLVAPGRLADPESGSPSGHLPATAAFVVRWGSADGGLNVRSVSYDASVEASGDSVQVDSTWLVHAQTPESELAIAQEGDAVVLLRDNKGDATLRVRDGLVYAVLRGAGEHEVQVRVRALVDRSEGEPRWSLTAPTSVAHLRFSVSGQREVNFDPPVPHTIGVTGEGDSATTLATADLPPGSVVDLSWTETRQAPETAERFNVEVYQIVRMSEGALKNEARLRYEVIRDGVRELLVEVPENAVVYRAEGPAIEDWRTFAASEDEPRRLRVSLGRELTGTFELVLELEMVTSTKEGTALDLPVVRPVGAFRETGVVALIDGDKVGFAPAKAEGWAKVGQDALPVEIRQSLTDNVAQAYKHIGRAEKLSSEVSAATQREVRFDAHTNTLYTIKDGALLASVSVQVEVKSGRTDQVFLDLPEQATVLALTAPSLNRSEAVAADSDDAKGVSEGRKRHRVRFAQALEGAIQIDLELEQLLPRDLGRIAVPDVHVVGADVQEGSFGVAAETGMEVEPAEFTDLRKIDAKELPKSVRLRSDREILLGHTYAHVPWKLELQVKRLDTVQTVPAVASPAWIETTVLDDGHVVTRALYQVANTDRQFLRLQLPAESSVWTVSADGQPVKAVRDGDGALAIPLPKAQTTLVELVYDQRHDALGFTASPDLVLPQIDILTTRLQWEVRVPLRFAALSVNTKLEEQPGGMYSPPRPDTGAMGALPIAIPQSGEMQSFTYALAVADPTEAPHGWKASLVRKPPPSVGPLLGLFALLALAFAVWRRARKRGGKGALLAALLGVAALVAKAIGWSVEPAELLLGAGVLLLVGALGWWSARRTGEDDE